MADGIRDGDHVETRLGPARLLVLRGYVFVKHRGPGHLRPFDDNETSTTP